MLFILIDWIKIIETAIGPLLGVLIGGGITITSLLFKEYLDRRREVQSWFEKQFILEGIDPLLLYLEKAHINLLMIDLGAESGLAQYPIGPPPMEALVRIIHLMRHGGFSSYLVTFINYIDLALNNPSTEIIKLLEKPNDKLSSYLVMLRQEMMELRLHKKTDAYNLIRNNEKILLALEYCKVDSKESLSKILNEIKPLKQFKAEEQTNKSL